jgi:hypothetical protein
MQTRTPVWLFAKISLLILVALFVIFWSLISSKVVHLSLSDTRECRWELNQWYTGRCVFSYYENGVRKGTMRTFKGLFERPVAIFPGPTDKTIICIYELDTTVAVFAVDFREADPKGIPPPQSLKETILFSNFRERACTKAEVTYLRNHISSTQDPLWRNAFAIFGSKVDPELGRQSLLRSVDFGTVRYEERDPTSWWRDYSKPQIPPED